MELKIEVSSNLSLIYGLIDMTVDVRNIKNIMCFKFSDWYILRNLNWTLKLFLIKFTASMFDLRAMKTEL